MIKTINTWIKMIQDYPELHDAFDDLLKNYNKIKIEYEEFVESSSIPKQKIDVNDAAYWDNKWKQETQRT